MASHRKMKKDWQAEWDQLAKEYRKLAKRANQRMVRIERYADRPGYKAMKEYAYKGAQQDIRALYAKEGDRLRYTEKPRVMDVKRNGVKLEGDEKLKANISSLKSKLSSIKHFLAARSSTIADIKDKETGTVKKGYMSTIDKRANTLNDRLKNIYGFDANLSADDLRRFFASKKQKKLENLVGSDQMFIVMAVMRDKGLKSNKKDLQKFFKQNIDLSKLPDDVSIDEKNYSSYQEYWDKLSEFIELTGDAMLDDYVTQAIKAGLSIKNLFI